MLKGARTVIAAAGRPLRRRTLRQPGARHGRQRRRAGGGHRRADRPGRRRLRRGMPWRLPARRGRREDQLTARRRRSASPPTCRMRSPWPAPSLPGCVADSIDERLAAAGLPPLPRAAWLEIDVGALANNVAVFREMVGPRVELGSRGQGGWLRARLEVGRPGRSSRPAPTGCAWPRSTRRWRCATPA